MLIDSHAHLDDFDDVPAVLARAQAAGVSPILAIGIGDGPATMPPRPRSRAASRQPLRVRRNPSAGSSPSHAEALAKLADLVQDPKCIAVGEIGLDYYHASNPEADVQQAAFVAQMQVAAAARKPILIHCRTSDLARPEAKARFGDADAWADLLALIAQHYTPTGLPGIMHCFSGTPADAEASLAAGFYLSFAGNLTYPKSNGIREAARLAPADRVLVETDAPFLAPIPYRGQTNEPALVVHTAGRWRNFAASPARSWRRRLPQTSGGSST